MVGAPRLLTIIFAAEMGGERYVGNFGSKNFNHETWEGDGNGNSMHVSLEGDGNGKSMFVSGQEAGDGNQCM